MTSPAATLTVLNEPVPAWRATAQTGESPWANSKWTNRTFRILLKGEHITTSGSTVQLTLRARAAEAYTVQRVSLVRRDKQTLNGVERTRQAVTFGGSGDAGVTVPAGQAVTSDPVSFDLEVGQDVFVTYWVSEGQPTVYRPGGAGTTAWTILGTDQSLTVDWEGLGITETRSHVYVIERLDVIPAGHMVENPPRITIPPTDVTVMPPAAATFTVGASGEAPLTYQWLRNGKPIVGATTASYTLVTTSRPDNGTRFAVVVSNDIGNVTSPAATLTVQAPPSPPTIVLPPADVTVNTPDPAVFRVGAEGTPPPSYQWRRDGLPIPGATGATFTLSSTTPGDTGAAFDVRITNTEGTVTSPAATLTVLNEPVPAWRATAQTGESPWANSKWTNRTFRILLKGEHITTSGSTVQLTLRARAAEAYTVQRVSLVRRDKQTLNGVERTRQAVTFGGSGDAGVTVPAGQAVTSDPVSFDLEVGQDVFVTYWVSEGQPTVYRPGGAGTTAWTILGTDQSLTVDWEGLGITETRSHVYVIERLDVIYLKEPLNQEGQHSEKPE